MDATATTPPPFLQPLLPTPFHARSRAASRVDQIRALGRLHHGRRLHHCRAGIFRDPQHLFRLRPDAHGQIPHHRPGRGTLPEPPSHPRRPQIETKSRSLHGLVQRRRPRHRRRHHLPPRRNRIPPLHGRASATTGYSTAPSASTSPSPKSPKQSPPSPARPHILRRIKIRRPPRRGPPKTVRYRPIYPQQPPDHHIAHRLYRRPRLRTLDGAARRRIRLGHPHASRLLRAASAQSAHRP